MTDIVEMPKPGQIWHSTKETRRVVCVDNGVITFTSEHGSERTIMTFVDSWYHWVLSSSAMQEIR